MSEPSDHPPADPPLPPPAAPASPEPLPASPARFGPDPYAPPPRRERVVFAAIAAFVVANVLSFVVISVSGYSGKSDEVLSPPVFFFSLLAVSGTFAIFSLLFARHAPEGLARRLLLVRPNIPPRLLWLLLPATWGVWIAGTPLAFLGKWIFGDSDSLLSFTGSYANAPWSWKLAFLAASTLGPGIGEELLFRGWLQHGLHRSRGYAFALVVTAVAFAGCHLPPARVLFILPLAFWLGYLALRTGSLFPGILCHVFVNLTGHLLLATDLDEVFVFSLAGLVGIPCLVMVMRIFRRMSLEAVARADEPPAPEAPLPSAPLPGQMPWSSIPRDDA